MKPKQTPEIASSRNIFIFEDDPALFTDFIYKRSRIITRFKSVSEGLNFQTESYYPNDQSGFLMTFSNYQHPKTFTTENFLSKLSSYDNILDFGENGYLLQDYVIGDIVLRVEDDSVAKAFYEGNNFDFDLSLMNLASHTDRLLMAFGVNSETIVIGGHLNLFN